MIYSEKIYDEIVKNIFDTEIVRKDDNLIVAFSGGMDSMCMLDAISHLRDEFRFKLYAVHINHGIRGIEAERDMNFVKRYCSDVGIKLIIRHVDAIKYAKNYNLSLEEAARILRYKEFEKIHKDFNKKNNAFILVAHHQNDQVETIIHNMLRGTGIKGLAGMNATNNYILRPLLNVKKREIEQYIETYNLPYVDDSTNDDTNYTRNFIRKEIMPKFLKVNDKAYDHIIDLSIEAKDAVMYLEAVAKYSYEYVVKSSDKCIIDINLDKFNQLNDLIKSYVIMLAFSTLVGTKKDIGRIHIEDIINTSCKTKGAHLDLPYNVTYDKKGNSILFTKNNQNISMSRRKKV